ncbi:MAG: hypothetical protein ACI8XU_001970, partial [Kiritimatiellia bacterium]
MHPLIAIFLVQSNSALVCRFAVIEAYPDYVQTAA